MFFHIPFIFQPIRIEETFSEKQKSKMFLQVVPDMKNLKVSFVHFLNNHAAQ